MTATNTAQNSTNTQDGIPAGLEFTVKIAQAYREILTPEALSFFVTLQREFGPRRKALLEERLVRQARWDAGELPDFLEETEAVREGDWRVAPLPENLADRRVEITGPPDRKMVINALNSGAKVFMADFEDSNAPTWDNGLAGQINLRDAMARTISFVKPDGSKTYELKDEVAQLFVRPRGWHLPEKHVLLDGEPVSGSLFDFALFFFHNARAALDVQGGPFFYLPKLEAHQEARLWNDVFVRAQDLLDIPQGSIKATVLVETITAVFEMDEILFELREHSAGLNCGRWDYIFSFIKKFRSRPDFVVPDRSQVGMTSHFLSSYSQLAIKTCHRRGAHAMGGMAAQIPIKNDPEASEAALNKVRADKERESNNGHDGTWVAHPGLVKLAMDIFDKNMPTPNQLHVKREDVNVTRDDLLKVPEGSISEQGLRVNIDVGIQYLEAWLMGNGCVPIYNLMEDAATSEISRTQVWQWVKHNATLDDGRTVSADLVRALIPEELAKIKALVGDARYVGGQYELASQLFEKLATDDELGEWLTLVAYENID
jgi:malate synthase